MFDPRRIVLWSFALLFASSAVFAQVSEAEFNRRRAEIRERYRLAAAADDLDAKREALNELIALERESGRRATIEPEPGTEGGGTNPGNSTATPGNSGTGSGTNAADPAATSGNTNPGLGRDGGLRPPGTTTNRRPSLFDRLRSFIDRILGRNRPPTTPPAGNPGGDTPAPTPAADPKVDLVSLTFKSDHGKLKDQVKDWTNTGSAFAEPEWTKGQGSAPGNNNPISHTMDQAVQVELELESSDAAAGKLVGTGSDLAFELAVTLAKGRSKHVLTSKGKLPKEVTKLDGLRIEWKLERSSGNPISLGNSGPHVIYITMDQPREEGRPEDGATVKRMEHAVKWVGEAGSLDPHEVVDHLFGKYRSYTLGFNFLPSHLRKRLEDKPEEKKALEAAGFAAYMKSELGGAWPLAEWVDFGGECQAIVRLTRGILTQTGTPGKAEPKYVNADAKDPYKAQIRDSGTRCTGPDSSKSYALSDSPIEKGKSYDDTAGIGWNNYEAYLRFEHANKVGWLGGGVGRLPSSQDPLNVFFGLAELEYNYENGGYKRKVTNLWDYSKHTWKPWTN